MYVRLAISEEQDSQKAFGEAWRAYAAATPRFIPNFSRDDGARPVSNQGPPLAWERALFWLCWDCLAAIGLWLARPIDIPMVGRSTLQTRTGERDAEHFQHAP